MLPVVICETDDTARAHWMDVLDDLARKEYSSLRLELLPGAERELSRTLETQRGIILVILSISSAAKGGIDGCIQRFLDVMDHNRDNYVVLCVENSTHLDAVLSRCMRPGGILVAPLREELMYASLKRILNDYAALHLNEDESKYMVVTSGKMLQRIAYQNILYLEAQNKLLNICMGRQVITVRSSMNELEKTLPDTFVRCHRSYIVNRMYVESYSLSDMMLELTTKERVPISRSYKDALRESLRGGNQQ